MHPSVTAYLHHLKAERNASPHTLLSYEDDLIQFAQFLSESLGIEPEAVDPTTADLRAAAAVRRLAFEQGYAPARSRGGSRVCGRSTASKGDGAR